MSILDFLVKAGMAFMDQAMETQKEAHRDMGRRMNNYERKLKKAEKNIDKMNPEQRAEIEEARRKLKKAKLKMNEKGIKVNNIGKILYGDKTLEQWNSEWISIGPLKTANLTPYNKYVGLYRHRIGGQIMYVGRAIELHNGGFRKRLSDYRRDNNSARKHKSGRIIHENLDRITTDILIVGDTEKSIEITKILEGQFIAKFNPEWNKMLKI